MSLTPAEEAQTRELLAQQAAILSLADSEAEIIGNLGATDVSLSDLTAATAIADADLMLVRQGTTDKSINPLIIDGRYLKKSGDTATGPLFGPNPATGNRSTLYATMQKFADEFACLMSGNGYQKLPSGLIIQWGAGVISSNPGTLTLPIAFPNGKLRTVANFQDLSINTVYSAMTTEDLGSATATVSFKSNGPGPHAGVSYIAIGY